MFGLNGGDRPARGRLAGREKEPMAFEANQPVSAGPGSGSTALVSDTTTAGFRQDVMTESMTRPVLVDFWAPWCGPCQMMAPEFAKAAAKAAGTAILVKVNTDERQDIAGQFRVQGIPAFALIKNGKLVSQTTGFQPAERLLAWMRSQ
jgi:putative thioredoxin